MSRRESDLLSALLAAREERAFVQRYILRALGGGCVVQIAVNVPGIPKTVCGDADAVAAGERLVVREIGRAPDIRLMSDGAAGICVVLGVASIDPLFAKSRCVAIETAYEWGRALDIDVVRESGPISRSDIGLPPRTCMICGREAKICARERAHDINDLRREVRRLLSLIRAPQADRDL